MSDLSDREIRPRSGGSSSQSSAHSSIRPLPKNNPTYYGGYGYAIPTGGKSVWDYLKIVYVYRFLIIFTTILGLCGGFFIKQENFQSFESSALVSIGPYVPPLDGPTSQALRIETQKGEYIAGLMPFLRSNSLARYVLTKNEEIRHYITGLLSLPPDVGLKVDSSISREEFEGRILDGHIDSSTDFPSLVLETYLDFLTANQVESTTLVKISATLPSARMAALLANAHAEGFMVLVRRQRMGTARVNVDFLSGRLEDARQKAEETERALIDFAAKNALLIGENGIVSNRAVEQYQGLIQGLSEASRERALAEGELQERQRSRSANLAKLDSDNPTLLQKLTELEAQIEDARRLGYNSAYIRNLRRQAERVEKLVQLNVQQEVRQGQIKTRAAAQREQFFQGELNQLKKADNRASEINLQFGVLNKAAKAAKDTLSELQKRLDDALINAESSQKTIRLVDPALPGNSIIASKHTSGVLTGFLFGLLFGCVLSFILDSQNQTIRSASQLQESIDAPILGLIPKFDINNQRSRGIVEVDSGQNILLPFVNMKEEPEPHFSTRHVRFSDSVSRLIAEPGMRFDASKPICSEAVVLVNQPQSAPSEAFRHVRATLKFSSRESSPKVILVTSAQKGDGKTTVALNLAVSFAQTSARTLLIDADLRLPQVHVHFGRQRTGGGLGEFLSSDIGVLEGNILESGVRNLSIMLAGSYAVNPAELLGSTKMESMLSQLAGEFEYLIIDTPPIGEISDALLLTRLVDGVVMVVRNGATEVSAVEMAHQKLQQIQSPVLGAVFNGASEGPSYGDKYGYTYSANS